MGLEESLWRRETCKAYAPLKSHNLQVQGKANNEKFAPRCKKIPTQIERTPAASVPLRYKNLPEQTS